MAVDLIQVDSSNVRVALGKFQFSLEQRGELMNQIGLSMLVSIRRTFREQGSPAHSWMPLAPSTIKSDPKRYGPGHQLLINKGMLLNSIGISQSRPDQVIIGTNVKYAAVHQFGSRDRGSAGFGPRTAQQNDAVVKVNSRTYDRVQSELGKGRMTITNSRGRRQMINKLIAGPRNATRVTARAHTRHQNIPARPYLVFRPEDPGRIQTLVNAYVRKAAASAGLEGTQ
jgi:phage virion morphogenesis protein